MTPAVPRFLSAATSEQGLVRSNNEDRVYCDDARGVFLVVDGMGGNHAGEKAAEIAADRIRLRLERQAGSVEQRIREAIALANNAIYETAQTQSEWEGMACVLTVVVIQDGEVTIGHVGDSRLYLLKPGRIAKITHDHSPIGEREDRGELSEGEAMAHPRRNEVFRDVGSEPHTPDDEGFIEILKIPFEPASAILLCSDGLSDAINSTEILSIVEQHAGDRWSSVRALFEAASKRGQDNISAVLVEGDEYAPSLHRPVVDGSRRVTVTNPAGEALTPNGTPWYLHRGAWLAAGLLAGVIMALAIGALAIVWQGGWHNAEPQPAGPQVLTVTAPETINAALEKARPGDTVVVRPGIYAEAVRLVNGVPVIAQPAHQAVIQGSVTAEDVPNARLEGFGIRGAVRIVNSDVVLARDEVSGAADAGVEFSGSSGGALAGSSIHNNSGAGIVVKDAASPTIEHNAIWGNGLTDRKALRPGMVVEGEAHPRIENNVFGSNGAESIRLSKADDDLAARNFFNFAPNDRKPKVRLVKPGEENRAPR